MNQNTQLSSSLYRLSQERWALVRAGKRFDRVRDRWTRAAIARAILINRKLARAMNN